MGLATARSIDVHAHAVLDGTLGAAGKYGPEIGATEEGQPWFRIGDFRLDGVRYRGGPFMDVDKRIDLMDQSGIEFQVLSPNPLTYFHFIENDAARTFCRRHNNELAALVAEHPERLAALAALPMQDPAAAAEELERAVSELGVLGAAVGAEMPIALDDARYDPLYETFARLDVPLFIHPAPAGIDGPAGDVRLGRFDLEILLGFAAQETLAIATLILGGVMTRHPELDVCVSHGGGSIVLLAERLADACRRRPWSPEYLRQDGAFETLLARFWLDNHVHASGGERMLEDIVGPEHIVLGTNFAGWDQPLTVDASDPLVHRLADNARSLLRVGT
jgi:aminocarboxymuconate-semialdehyde decarboxylase